jgi:hypothetical protein
MLSLFLFSVSSALVLAPISPTDPSVTIVKPYLDKTIPLLFPDAHSLPEIVAASKEGTTSYILNLTIKTLPSLQFNVILAVTAEGKAAYQGFTGPTSESSGGYR